MTIFGIGGFEVLLIGIVLPYSLFTARLNLRILQINACCRNIYQATVKLRNTYCASHGHHRHFSAIASCRMGHWSSPSTQQNTGPLNSVSPKSPVIWNSLCGHLASHKAFPINRGLWALELVEFLLFSVIRKPLANLNCYFITFWRSPGLNNCWW